MRSDVKVCQGYLSFPGSATALPLLEVFFFCFFFHGCMSKTRRGLAL